MLTLKRILPFVAAIVAACSSSDASAPPVANVPTTLPYRIDVHAHLLPEFYNLDLIAHGHAVGGGGVPNPAWTPQLAVAFMDSYGIAAQIVSVSEPGVAYLETPQERLSMAQRLNDYMRTDLVASPDPSSAGRFGALAVMPIGDAGPQDILNASDEAVRALVGLGLDGIGLFSSYGDVYLGDPRLDPLMATLDALGAVVFVHPVTPSVMPNTGIPAFLLEFPFETTRAVVKMLTLGIFQRYPNIRWVVAHAGGTVPFISYRSSLLTLVPAIAQNLSNLGIELDVNDAYAGLYYDTALSASASAMRATRAVTDIEHILFGTDWPYSAPVFVVPGHPAPQLTDTFSSDELDLVEHGNALMLFPGLASRLAR